MVEYLQITEICMDVPWKWQKCAVCAVWVGDLGALNFNTVQEHLHTLFRFGLHPLTEGERDVWRGLLSHRREKQQGQSGEQQYSNKVSQAYFSCLSSSFCLSFSCFDAFPWEQQDRAGRCCCPWCRNNQTEQDEDAVLEDFCYLRLSSLSTARQFKTHAHAQKDKYSSTPMPSQTYTLWKTIRVHIEAELCIVMMMPLVCPQLAHPSLYWIKPSSSHTYQASCFLSKQASNSNPQETWTLLGMFVSDNFKDSGCSVCTRLHQAAKIPFVRAWESLNAI